MLEGNSKERGGSGVWSDEAGVWSGGELDHGEERG